jgi:cupin fold WbuC family metalloprotein
MIKIDTALLDEISSAARSSGRLRMNHNFHPMLEDTLHRMLNAMEPGTYIQPHKHQDPDRFEVFLVLKGSFVVITFDDKGNIADHIVLDEASGKYGVEIPERTYHTLIPLQSGSVAYEVKAGPYTPLTAKSFAPWAPAEGDPGVEHYIAVLLQSIGLNQINRNQ